MIQNTTDTPDLKEQESAEKDKKNAAEGVKKGRKIESLIH